MGLQKSYQIPEAVMIRNGYGTYYLQKKGSGMMAGKKWWIWLLAVLVAAGVLAVLLMQQGTPQTQKGGTLVQRLEAMCHG